MTNNIGLKIDKRVMEQILQHVRQSYPNECCGVLIGASYDNKQVIASQEIPNVNPLRLRDRYLMDSKALNKVMLETSKNKQEILGFYHSHPDHPAQPSEFDREHAWPVYSYVVVACEKGKKTQARSWVLEEETSRFHEETLLVI